MVGSYLLQLQPEGWLAILRYLWLVRAGSLHVREVEVEVRSMVVRYLQYRVGVVGAVRRTTDD